MTIWTFGLYLVVPESENHLLKDTYVIKHIAEGKMLKHDRSASLLSQNLIFIVFFWNIYCLVWFLIIVFHSNLRKQRCLESCPSTSTSRSHDGTKAHSWGAPSTSSWSQIPGLFCCLLRLWRRLVLSWLTTGRVSGDTSVEEGYKWSWGGQCDWFHVLYGPTSLSKPVY